MTVNHGVLGSSPCSGADARGLRKVLSKRLQGAAEERGGSGKAGFLKWNTGELADLRCDPLNGKRSLKIGRFLCSPKPFFLKREFSSAGSEHLPYKQRVGGSNPSTPTNRFRPLMTSGFYFLSDFISLIFPRQRSGWNRYHGKNLPRYSFFPLKRICSDRPLFAGFGSIP